MYTAIHKFFSNNIIPVITQLKMMTRYCTQHAKWIGATYIDGLGRARKT